MSKITNQIANKLNNKYRTKHKPSESTSSKVQSWTVRDSRPSRNHMTNNKLLVLSLGLFSLSAFLMIGSNGAAFAADSLTMTIDNSTVELNGTATTNNSNGTFIKSANRRVSVSTTNGTGYNLKIAASSDADYNKLINNSDNTKYLTSISSATTEEEFKSLDTDNVINYKGKWGYLPSKLNSQDNTSFLPAPTATGDTLDITNTANTTANTYDLAIGARIDSSISLGTYSNVYLVSVTTNAIPYTITYNDSIVTNMPTDIKDGTYDSTVPISTNIPVRDGYKFLGWCTVMPTSSNGTDLDTCSGKQYSAGEGWGIDESASSNNLQLFAMWGQPVSFAKAFANAGKTQQSGYYKMQDMTSSICSAVDTGESADLIDIRSGSEVYKVAKLADNKCWMLDNLRLGSASTIALTSSDTNISSPYTLPAGTTSGFTIGSLTSKINVVYKNDTIASYGPGSGKVGVYYNYCAASAGTICSSSKLSDVSDYDICPAGWRMPTGGSSGEYQALFTAYNSNKTATDTGSLQYNLSTPLSGYFYDSAQEDFGSKGSFWSSSPSRTKNFRYKLGVDSSNVYPTDHSNCMAAHAMRCVAK